MKYSIKFLLISMFFISLQVQAQVEYPYYVPEKVRITKINIEALPRADSGIGEGTNFKELQESYSHSVEEFVVTPNRGKPCESVLKENFKCLEIENTQIGYKDKLPNYYYFLDDFYFRQLSGDADSILVYYDVKKNYFYIRPSDNSTVVFGAFKGEPIAELNKAAFPQKERNNFACVSMTYFSKRWEFPNEEDIIKKYRNRGDYDFVGGRMSGRQMESFALDSQFFRFRLENKSGKDLYFLNNNNDIETFALSKFPKDIGWRRSSLQPFNSAKDYNMGSLNWVSLPNNSAFEFEIKTGCSEKETCATGIYLNDTRSFRDVVEIIAVFPGNKPRKFSKKNAPPKRRTNFLPFAIPKKDN